MRFNLTIDVPDETIALWQQIFAAEDKECSDLEQLVGLVQDIVADQTGWDVLDCTPLDLESFLSLLNSMTDCFPEETESEV